MVAAVCRPCAGLACALRWQRAVVAGTSCSKALSPVFSSASRHCMQRAANQPRMILVPRILARSHP
jgi:hypothetical protein